MELNNLKWEHKILFPHPHHETISWSRGEKVLKSMKLNSLSPRDQEIISWWGWGEIIFFLTLLPPHHETISWSRGDFIKTQI